MDSGIEFQQNYGGSQLIFIVLRARSNRLRDTEPLMITVLALLPTLRPGTMTVVE